MSKRITFRFSSFEPDGLIHIHWCLATKIFPQPEYLNAKPDEPIIAAWRVDDEVQAEDWKGTLFVRLNRLVKDVRIDVVDTAGP